MSRFAFHEEREQRVDHERLTPVRLALAILIAGAALAGSGCSTIPPMDSGRKGLLQALAASHGGHLVRGPEISEHAAFPLPARGTLQWPLEHVHVTSFFGRRSGEFHEGVDLRARPGTPIYAASPGVVIYADSSIRGYGKMVVIRHRSGLSTVYAHASRTLVRRGERVVAGQEIALSGSTGRTRGPHLHFEVRRGLEAINPLRVLPNPFFRHGPRMREKSRMAKWWNRQESNL